MTRNACLGILGFILASCGTKQDTAGPSETDTDTEDTDTDSTSDGFGISGTAWNFMAVKSTPAVEGLCVYAADPTPALAGGEMDRLTSSTLGANGVYEVTGIETVSVVGLLMLVEDCGGEGTVMPTATGVSYDDYHDLENGDMMKGRDIWSVDAASQTLLQNGLAAAGYVGDLGEDGALVGFILSADGQPIEGATIEGPSSASMYYFDGKGFNRDGTVAAGRGMFVIPGAPIYTYNPAADGYDFEGLMAGSQVGVAVIVRFFAM